MYQAIVWQNYKAYTQTERFAAINPLNSQQKYYHNNPMFDKKNTSASWCVEVFKGLKKGS